jgi:muconate cycloisomerase
MSILSVSAEPILGHVRPDIAIISSLGSHVVGQYVLVRIADDEGRVGLGEASVTCVWSGETQAGTIAVVREVLAPLVIGADPFDTEWIDRRMERAAFGNSFARAAVEMALLDLQGRILGVPVYKLLGGRDRSAGRRRPVFGSSSWSAPSRRRSRRSAPAGWSSAAGARSR